MQQTAKRSAGKHKGSKKKEKKSRGEKIKLEHVEEEAKNIQKEKKRSKEIIMCIDDEDEAISETPSKKIKQNEKIEKGQSEQFMEEAEFFSKNYLDKLPKDESVKVIKLNHFFKWKGTLYFEVMVGTSTNEIFREPQLITFESLCADSTTKQLVFHHIANLCQNIAGTEKTEKEKECET